MAGLGSTIGGATVRRASLASASVQLTRLAIGVAILISPLRVRWVIGGTPVPGLWAGYTDISITPVGLAILAAVGAWLAGVAVGQARPSLEPRWLIAAGALLVAMAWIGVPFSIDPWLALARAAELTLLALFALAVRDAVEGPRTLVGPVLVMVAVQGSIAIGQVLAGHSLGLGWLGEYQVDPSTSGAAIVGSVDGVRHLRAYGLTDHPNILGGLLAAALPIVGAALVDPAPMPGSRRWGIGVIAAIGVAGLVVTFSRGAWLAEVAGAAAGLAVLVLAAGGDLLRRGMVVAAFGAVIALAVAWPLRAWVGSRLLLDSDRSTYEVRSLDERASLLDAGLQVAAAHPLLGTGIGTAAEAIADEARPLAYAPQPPHAVLVTAAVELGLIGGAGVAVALGGPILALVGVARRTGPASHALDRARRTGGALGVATAAAVLVVVVVSGLFDYYPWSLAPGQAWSWLAIGLAAGILVRHATRTQAPDLGAEAGT